MSRRNRYVASLVALATVTVLVLALAAGVIAATAELVVPAGQTETINATTALNKLVLGDGATITAPVGYSLTLTVNEVETGGKLRTTAGAETDIVGPATYEGRVVLTVAVETLVPALIMGPPDTPPSLMFPFRQALYIDAKGVDWAKSVRAAVVGGVVTDTYAKDIQLTSTGENFNGINATGGSYTVTNATISFAGNGRNDFTGYGAAVSATGEDTTLVLDGARIETWGSARPAVVATGGSNVIVKNSWLHTHDGVLPADFVPNVDLAQMRSAPWMLSLSGNVRATNLLGTETKAAYINSYVGSDGWGVLSLDTGEHCSLTVINSTIATTGEDGYGAFALGDPTERFLGSTFDAGTYGVIFGSGTAVFGDSTPEAVAEANTAVGLGLTQAELNALKVKPTTVTSRRYGMSVGGGSIDITGHTTFNCAKAVFLIGGSAADINVDGSQGAQLNSENGVIIQLIDSDDPGVVMPKMENTAVYTEPTGPVIRKADHDITVAGATDALATFSNMTLAGDFYNGMRGDTMANAFAAMLGMVAEPKNLGLTFDNTDVTGVITSSDAHHAKSTIGAEDFRLLKEVTNTPSPAVNNGVIVSLKNGSTWTVTGTCYLTSLSFDKGTSINAPAGYKVSMTLDGEPQLLRPGTYTGAIVLKTTPLSVFGGTTLHSLLGPATD